MANIHIKREHNFGIDEARKRVDQMANSLQDRLEAKMSWKGNTLNIKRTGASGTVEVGDDYVECEVKLGLVLKPMKGMVESELNNALDEALG